eukprot:scaffold3941_cov201-Alexandrium_tamarense.AAC.5
MAEYGGREKEPMMMGRKSIKLSLIKSRLCRAGRAGWCDFSVTSFSRDSAARDCVSPHCSTKQHETSGLLRVAFYMRHDR